MENYRLIANTFFYLLLCIRQGGINGRTPSQAACFRTFIEIADPKAVEEYKEGSDLYSFRSHASHFRTAAPEGKTNKYMHFGDALTADEFESRLRNDTEEIFSAIDHYFETYTKNTEYCKKWLVKQLLGLIEADTSINKNKFIINPKFVQSYKDDVLKQEKINFYYFIAGMWLYVYRYNSDISLGKATIEVWDAKKDIQDLMGIGNKFDNVEITFEKTIVNEIALDLSVKEKQERMVFVDTNDIAPDLAEIDPEDIIFAQEGVVDEETPYSKYLKNIREKHYNIETFIYENARPLDSFYVCNRLELLPNYFMSQADAQMYMTIEDATIDKLPLMQKGIIISAEGGMGKSMMLHHLVVDMVDRFGTVGLIPIFVTARLYDPGKLDFTDLVYSEFTRHNNKFTLEDMTMLFATGKAIVMIDGIDEVNSNYIDSFMDEYDRFMDYYPAVRCILSMRNHVNSRVISKFWKYALQPFDIDQATLMVSKLDKYVISESTKEDFIDSLRNGKNGIDWDKQKDFLGNPLLLTIMLLAYDENYEIPTQRYLFYQYAYEAMAKKHDATKNLRREFRTGLTIDKFQLYFGEFCAATYGEEKYEFKEDELRAYLGEVIDANNINTTVDLFIADIIEKLCLMYKDGDEYHFIHRSFQEYFTAFFFSKQDARYYKPIYEMFECYDECRHDDQVLNMLYGMAEQSVELHIIIPFLKEITEGEYGGYGFFLDRIYPCLYFEDGECGKHFTLDDSESAIYNFIRNHYGIQQESILQVVECMPYRQPLMTFYYVPENWQDTNNPGKDILVDYEDIDPEYFEMYDCESNPAGRLYEIPFSEVTSRAEENMEFLEYLFNDDFPLKIEYDLAVELLKKLEKKYEEKTNGDRKSFISRFH